MSDFQGSVARGVPLPLVNQVPEPASLLLLVVSTFKSPPPDTPNPSSIWAMIFGGAPAGLVGVG
jgi:hypothetical protein